MSRRIREAAPAKVNLTLEVLGRREDGYHELASVMATIGRSRAVARIGRIRLSGFVAWVVWLLAHILFLIDFRNRILVLIDWAWSYFTYERGSRLITGRRLDAGAPASTRTAPPPPAREIPAPPKSLSS